MKGQHAIAALLALCACTGSAPTPPPDDAQEPETPFEPDSPKVYVAKVKNLLVGLPPTDEEITAVTADPNALGGLIKDWQAQPEYQHKMLRFFQLAFQQTQLTKAAFIDISPIMLGLSRTVLPDLLLRNIEESFARTVLELNAEGRPFTEAMTTKRFMMTTPLMEWYAYLDTVYLDDGARPVNRMPGMTGDKMVYIGSQQVPLSDSLDPSKTNFMRFTDPVTSNAGTGCDPLVYDPHYPGAYGRGAGGLHNWFYGLVTIAGYKGSGGATCTAKSYAPATIFFTPPDFDNWRMIDIRQPTGTQPTAEFWNIPALRTANELVLKTPREGFFSTPAFHANWSTNDSNQMRVTANQALIVALGEGFDGDDATIPADTPGLDATHATPGTACFGCHQLLDPMRAVLAANYSWGYGQQTDPAFANQPAQFAFEGVIKPMSTLDDFANDLATHPQFARAWVQKLCYYANSSPCSYDDPEFQRVVSVFVDSNYQWDTLVRELFASPLITHASRTMTADTNGVVVAVTRIDHLCAALNHRLGLTDACVLDPLNHVPPPRTSTIEKVTGGLPSDGYGRGAVVPVLPNEPSLFFRAAVENICIGIANQVIDGTTPKWTSSNPDAAIADFVSVMMGMTASDTRAAPATAVLKAHYDAAVQTASPTDALKSTFVVSCLAPSFVAIGI